MPDGRAGEIGFARQGFLRKRFPRGNRGGGHLLLAGQRRSPGRGGVGPFFAAASVRPWGHSSCAFWRLRRFLYDKPLYNHLEEVVARDPETLSEILVGEQRDVARLEVGRNQFSIEDSGVSRCQSWSQHFVRVRLTTICVQIQTS